MSYCRWSSNSDIYVFDHSFYQSCCCFGCLLEDDYDGEGTYDNYTSRNLQEFIQHIQKHRDAGHKVPDDLEDRLKERWTYSY